MHNENLLLLADAYKYSHHKLYYPVTTKIYSYLESRGGKFDEVVFFGLQYFLKRYLTGPAFTKADVDEAAELLPQVFGRDDVFDRSKFDYILEKYDGHLPVRIKAVPEGTIVPTRNVLMTIESTDPECFWLSNFLETLLMQVWYPCTVATLSHEVRKVVEHYYEETSDEASFPMIDFVLNDFGVRGTSSVESAGIGGAAHLINFSGSDNIVGSVFAKRYYGAGRMMGVSVPATEHSVCTLLGEKGEKEVYRHILEVFPTGIVACVSDSYNIFKACKEFWGDEFKEQILNRDGKLVIRPDSGDPVATLLVLFDILFERFGYTLNSKGYKVLPPQVSILQGDGVNYDAIKVMFEALRANGIAAENLVLGMGGALLQKLDRDTQKFALKCSYAERNGRPVDVQKSPTEMDANGTIQPSFKKSKAGRLKLVKEDETLITLREEERPELEDQMLLVFENGKLVDEQSFEEIKTKIQTSKMDVLEKEMIL